MPSRGKCRALLWSFAYFFFLLSTYYMLLPMRDAMGIGGGRAGSAVVVLRHIRRVADHCAIAGGAGGEAAAPALHSGVLPVPRRQHAGVLVPAEIGNRRGGVARAFFIWITVFSVFTVSMFWSFMADLYSSEQSKRLFGFIAAGGSLGNILGPILDKQLVGPIGVANLLLVAGTLLIGAVFCANRLESCGGAIGRPPIRTLSRPAQGARRSRWAAACSMASGCCSSLPTWAASACGYSCCRCSAPSSTSRRLHVVASYTRRYEAAARSIFCHHLHVGGHPVTGGAAAGNGPHHQRRSAPARALAILPLVFVVGFTGLMFTLGAVAAIAAFQACQRASNFGIANVARESLWPVVSREEKFKAKNIVDGAVFRGADLRQRVHLHRSGKGDGSAAGDRGHWRRCWPVAGPHFPSAWAAPRKSVPARQPE